jgi:hypothetical protein
MFWDTEAEIEQLNEKSECHRVKLIVWRVVDLDECGQIIKDEWGHTADIEEYINQVEASAINNGHLYLICHNASYDVQISGIITRLFKRDWRHTGSVLQFPPFIFHLKRANKRLTLLDSLNYARHSLAALGKSIGLEKGEYDYRIKGVTEDLVAYAYQDVKILSEWFLSYYRFLVDNDLSPFATTLASQAFRTYRYRFFSGVIPLHREKDVQEIERFSYIGGRVECFRLGDFSGQTYYKLDVNSMYPYVMREYDYPTVYLGSKPYINKAWFETLHRTKYLIIKVKIKTRQPLFPVRLPDRVIYPVGEFETVLHSGEIELMLRYAEDYKVVQVYVYKREKIFSAYVDYFYILKQDAERERDAVKRSIAKMFMNSLYGKFGQIGHHEILLDEGDPDGKFYRYQGYSERHGCNVMINHIDGRETTTLNEGESYYSHPAIAGAVTSYARAYLMEMILTAGIENLFYVDTDSLIVNQAGYDELADYMDADLLGALKLEGVENSIQINGLKDYRFGNLVKIKGVSSKAVQLSDTQYSYPHFRGGVEWLKTGDTDRVYVTQQVKTLKRLYNKATLYEGRVSPFILPDPEIIPLSLP